MAVMTGGFLILAVETAPESNIRTAEEAVWWSFVTVTTVGRILVSFLMLFGIGILAPTPRLLRTSCCRAGCGNLQRKMKSQNLKRAEELAVA